MCVDEEKGDRDDESDVELDGNNQLDLDLDLEHKTTILSQIYSPLQKNFSDPQLFQN